MIPKFRAWDKVNKKLKQVYSIDFDKNGEIESVKEEYTKPNEIYAMFDIGYFKLMQSTGLKDINGTEIYEGDILKTSIKNLVVEWVPKGACWGIGCHYLFHYYETSEVIGNIYENPELLEG